MKSRVLILLYMESQLSLNHLYRILISTTLICQVFHSEAYRASGISTSTFISSYESSPLFYVPDLMSQLICIYMNIYYLVRQFLIFFISYKNIFIILDSFHFYKIL